MEYSSILNEREHRSLHRKALIAQTKDPSLRIGQAYFIALESINPGLANKIRTDWTEIDPFHNDSVLPAFFAYITR